VIYLLFYSDGIYSTTMVMASTNKDQILCRKNHLLSLNYWVATAEVEPGGEVPVFEQIWRHKQFMKEGM